MVSVTTETAAVSDGLEEVAVGDGTKTLVPGVVARSEVGVDVVPGGQLALETLAQESLHLLRVAPAQRIEGLGHQGVGPLAAVPAYCLGSTWRKSLAIGSALRQGGDVGRRALQHRDVGRRAGQGGHQGHRGGAAADDHDPLADVVEVLGPVLGVNEGAGEVAHAGEVGQVAVVVAVVAGAREEEARGELDGAAVRRVSP